MLGAVPGAAALAWSRLAVTAPGGADARLLIRSRDVAALKVFVDGRLAAIQPEASAGLECVLPLDFGSHDLLVEAVCGGPGWGFRLEAAEAGNTSEVQVEAECSAALAEASPCCSPQGTLNKGAGASGVHGTVKLVSPCPVEGQTGPWLYLGPFLQSAAPLPAEAASMDAPFGEGAEECFGGWTVLVGQSGHIWRVRCTDAGIIRWG